MESVIRGVAMAIAPNSDVLDDLRKGSRAGFFAPQGEEYLKNTPFWGSNGWSIPKKAHF